MPGDPPIHFLELSGTNPRSYSFIGLDAIMDEKHPRVVLLDNDPVSYMAIQTGKWCKQHNSFLYCISCENLLLDITNGLKRRGIKALPAIIAKRIILMQSRKLVSGIFSINRDGVNIFKEENFAHVEHMPLGFNPDVFYVDDDARQTIRMQLNIDKPVVAYFGRLVKEKGIHLLIEAMSGLKMLEWQLMMDDFDVFASPYNQEVRNLLEKHDLLDRVIFVHPNHFEIAAYMNAADIVVVPSIATRHWKEQYGRVAAEAMACGKLVIASDSGALPELLNGRGLIFPEGDVSKLQSVLKDSLVKISNGENPFKDRHEIAQYAVAELSLNKQAEILLRTLKTEHEDFVGGQ